MNTFVFHGFCYGKWVKLLCFFLQANDKEMDLHGFTICGSGARPSHSYLESCICAGYVDQYTAVRPSHILLPLLFYSLCIPGLRDALKLGWQKSTPNASAAEITKPQNHLKMCQNTKIMEDPKSVSYFCTECQGMHGRTWKQLKSMPDSLTEFVTNIHPAPIIKSHQQHPSTKKTPDPNLKTTTSWICLLKKAGQNDTCFPKGIQ